jgi:ribonucleoside-diphosphate reductase alpha chain
MEIIENATRTAGFDDSWDLIDPHTGKVTKTVSAKTLWVKLIQNRVETGEPYIMFGDTVQSALPNCQADKGLKVNHSNLCSEITLATDENRTAVCCLSSVNLEEYDEWSTNPQFIPDLIRMLDNVITYFVENAPAELAKAVYSAEQERSLGLGAMGFHAYLQRQNIPFESAVAKGKNMQMFRRIKTEAENATKQLAEERGECPDGMGYGIRNAHLLAVAPNASSSIICGNTSPSIEPYRANAFTQKTKSGSSLLKNEYLEHVLQEMDQDTDEVWKSIITNNGSVQHLDFLDEWTKDVFKTAVEIDQRWIIDMAADRQEQICQSQSLNVFFPANVSKQELHAIHMMAWKKKVKTLYYLRSEAIKRAETVSDEALRQYIFESMDEEGCLACEG